MDRAEIPMPRLAVAVQDMLDDAEVEDVEPHVISQLMEIASRYTKDIISHAESYRIHAGHSTIEDTDIDLAVRVSESSLTAESSLSNPLRPEQIIERTMKELNVEELNRAKLPSAPARLGALLPPEKYCTIAPNFQVNTTTSNKE